MADGWAPYTADQLYGRDHDPAYSPRAAPATPGMGPAGLDDGLYSSARQATTTSFERAGGLPMSIGYDELARPNGVDIAFRGVSVAIKHNVIVENICRYKSRVLVRSAIGLFRRGRVHAIVALGEEPATGLADALSGRLTPCEGTVWADGLPVRVALYRESVGVVRKLSWTVPEFTIEENLHFAGAMRRGGQAEAERQKQVVLLAQVLRLELGAKVKALNPNESRRVDVAMEMMAAPPALFVHNPLWGLDCHHRADFMAYLARLARTFGTTVIITTPRLELGAYDLLDSLVVLGHGGHTVFSGPRSTLATYFIARVANPLHRVPTERPSSTSVTPAAPRRHASATTAADNGRGGPAQRPAKIVSAGSRSNVECAPLLEPDDDTQPPGEAMAADHHGHNGGGGHHRDRDRSDALVAGSLQLPSLVRSRSSLFAMSGMAAARPEPSPLSVGGGGGAEGGGDFVDARGSWATGHAPTREPSTAMSGVSSWTATGGVGGAAAAGPTAAVAAGATANGRGGNPSLLVQPRRGETALQYQHQDDETFLGSSGAEVTDLDGGDIVLDYVQLWGDLGATDRYAAAFFDSSNHRALDDAIHTAVALSRANAEQPPWLASPLVQPGVCAKFGRLLWVNLRQRALQLDWYVGWVIMTVGVAACVWLAHIQSNSQEGMFNVRGIIFFMYVLTLTINGSLIRSYAEEIERFMHLKASGIAPTVVQLAVTIVTMWITRVLYLAPATVALVVALNGKDAVGLDITTMLVCVSWAHIMFVYVALLFVRTVRYAAALVWSVDAAMIFFSGFLVNVRDSPASNFSQASVVRYGYGASVASLLRDQAMSCDGFSNRTGESYCYSGPAYLKLEGFENDTVQNCATTLVLFATCATVLAFTRMLFL